MIERSLHLGLDSTEGHLHALTGTVHGGDLRIHHLLSLHVGRDGILDSGELSQAFQQWIDKELPAGVPTTAGLPTFLTSTALFQFPHQPSREGTNKIIQFQTRQLCGMEEEPFGGDSQYFGETDDGLQSAVISVCKEAELEAACTKCQNHGLRIQALTSSALAMANAFCYLYPQESKSEATQLLLHIDQVETTLVLWKKQLPFQIQVIPFGEKQLLSTVASKGKPSLVVRAAGGNDAQPLSHQQKNNLLFIQEVRSFLKQLSEADKQEPPRKIWLTGEGALIPGLPEEFANQLQCPTELFGLPHDLLADCGNAPSCPNGFDCHPALTIAFGLLLQTLNQARFQLRLLPPRIRWQQEKMRQFPVLVSAAVLLILALCIALSVRLCHLNRQISVVNQKMKNLKECIDLIPELEKSYNEIEFHQKCILPIIEYGTRLEHFSDTLKNCGKILRPEVIHKPVYCVYLADEFTFQQEYSPEKEKSDAPVTKQPREELSLFGTTARDAPPVDKNSIAIVDFPVLKTMYLGGLTLSGDEKFTVIKEIQTKLHEQSVFNNVDDIYDSIHFEDAQLFPQWNRFLETESDKWTELYSLFLLKIPFLNTLTSSPQPPQQ